MTIVPSINGSTQEEVPFRHSYRIQYIWRTMLALYVISQNFQIGFYLLNTPCFSESLSGFNLTWFISLCLIGLILYIHFQYIDVLRIKLPHMFIIKRIYILHRLLEKSVVNFRIGLQIGRLNSLTYITKILICFIQPQILNKQFE